jgi:hypothetical protein
MPGDLPKLPKQPKQIAQALDQMSPEDCRFVERALHNPGAAERELRDADFADEEEASNA